MAAYKLVRTSSQDQSLDAFFSPVAPAAAASAPAASSGDGVPSVAADEPMDDADPSDGLVLSIIA